MSKAICCDRCGTYFSGYNENSRNYYEIQFVGSIQRHFDGIRPIEKIEKIDIDLCPACQYKFKEWMKNV